MSERHMIGKQIVAGIDVSPEDARAIGGTRNEQHPLARACTRVVIVLTIVVWPLVYLATHQPNPTAACTAGVKR